MSHNSYKPKSFSIVVIPDNQKEPKTYKLSYWSLRILIGILITVAVLIVLGAATYWKVASVAVDYISLKEDNFKLQKGLEQMEQLKKDLLKMQQFEKKLRGSIDGYVKIEQMAEQDSIEDLNFDKMNPDQRRTIFNSIPNLMPVNGFVTRGYDINPLLNEPHIGIDIAASKGSSIRATADGVVVFSGWTSTIGYVVIIQHDFGFSSVYGHNERNLVEVMKKVKKGDVIALLGDTGKISSGPHLHFEIWRNGQPLDPVYYIGENIKDRS